MTAPECQRCGAKHEIYVTEDYDPLTGEGRRIYLCADCMYRLARIHDLFLRGEDE